MLVWACIAPHGGELIPALAQGNLGRMAVTRSSMMELGSRCLEAAPDTIVVFTPHGIQAPDLVTVSACESAIGSLDAEDGSVVSAAFEVDLELSETLIQSCHRSGLAALPIAFADEEHNPLPFQLDWGAFIPLWFMGARWDRQPKIVVLCPSRSLPRQTLVDFGRVVAESCEAAGRRIAVICSADQGHGHDEAGPYGYAAESAQYDAAYVSAVREGALENLLAWPGEWIDCAMTDSYWQTLMLYGVLCHTAMRPELLSYEAPTYFGMVCAAFGHPKV